MNQIPIDTVTLARKYFKLKVFSTNLPEEVAAAFVNKDTIVLDNNDSKHRKRFLIAFLLGCIDYHSGLSDHIYLRKRTQPETEKERYALKYALGLLVPDKEFERLKKQYPDTFLIHGIFKFGIPPEILSMKGNI